MPLDAYRSLGRSGLRVSPFCLGGMTFGEEWGYGSDEAGSSAIIQRYTELGGNFIDTANMYTLGHSEAIIGKHFEGRRGERNRVVIATKFSANMSPGDPNGGGSSRKAILAACEESLRRLRTDYIDLYWMHWWDQFTPIEETMSALDSLVQSGKVRYVGFSDTPAWKVAQAQVTAMFRNWAPIVGLQIEYSLLERTVESELTPMALELGLGVTPWSPLRAGALSGKYSRDNTTPESAGRGPSLSRNLTPKAFDVIDVLLAVAKEAETSAASVALAWVLAQPAVTSPIIGARTLDQLTDNLQALEVRLTTDQLTRLNEVSTPPADFTALNMRGAMSGSFGGLTVNARTFPLGLRSVTENDKVW
ncbi:MAG: aldo/keto reductase [Phenylobacterium sp.]|uniref:aldo/keto reductase n=1 Tax=Phenylobacterium sp. TaxID=1871053 RepID=UPI00273576D5|nr:aldo/keto reductase [Phenylobacterium sp.]MDP3174394.1 aldo/keto reductase [Phenylobacterium sp.]